MTNFIVQTLGWLIVFANAGTLTGWQTAGIIIGVIMTGLELE